MQPIKTTNLRNIAKLLVLSLVFIAPIKFGLPFVDNIPNFWPGSGWEWLLWSWPAEMFFLICFLMSLILVPFIIALGKLSFPCVFPIACFFALGLPSVLASVCVPASVIQYFQFGSYFLIWGLVVNTGERDSDHKIFVNIICVSAWIVIIYGAYQHFYGFHSVQEYLNSLPSSDLHSAVGEKLGMKRVFSTFIYPNILAGYLVCVLPLGIASFFYADKRHEKILHAVFVAACTFVFVLTRSKGGAAAFWVVAFFTTLAFLTKHKRKYMVFICGAAAVLIAACYLLIYLPDISSLLSRADYWASSFDIIRDHLWLGTGPGTFSYIYPKYMLPGAEETKMVHNNFLQLFLEWGPGPFLCFMAFFLFPLYRIREIIKDKLAFAMLMGMIGFFIHSFIDFDLYVPGLAVIVFVYHALIVRRVGLVGTSEMKSWQKCLILVVFTIISLASVWVLSCRIKADRLTEAGHSSLAENNVGEAIYYLEDAAASGMETPYTWYLLGRAYANLGNFSDARRAYREGINRVDSNAELYAAMALLYTREAQVKPYDKNGLLDKAAFFMEKAVKCYPANPEYHARLAHLYLEMGDIITEAKQEANNARRMMALSRRKDPNVKRLLDKIDLLLKRQK